MTHCSTAIVLAALALAVAAPARAQSQTESQSQGYTPELGRAIDEEIEAALREQRLTSAVVAVVDHSGLAFHKGYGLADPPERPADPTRTQYLIGSITKTFTGTVILQLLAEGKIKSLADAANVYLRRVRIESWKDRPVTVGDLLTHQGGFDEHLFEMAPTRRYDTPTSAADLKRLIPPVVREPGSFVAYSNDGYGVLGVLIEDIEGETLQAVMRRRIFEPFGMTHTDLPYHEERLPEVAKAYYHGAGASTVMPFVGNTPFMAAAGSVVSTADDMGRYMLAQLDIGEGAGRLAESVRTALRTPRASNSGAMAKMGGSMMIDTWNGHTLLEHGGLRVGYSSHMLLIPQAQLGVFIAIAGAADPKSGAAQFRANLVRNRVLNELYGEYTLPAELTQATVFAADMHAFEGDYIPERRPLRGKKSVLSPAYIQQVRVDEQGDLTIGGRAQRRIGESLFVNLPGPGEAPSYTAFEPRGGHMMMMGAVSASQRIEGRLHPRVAVLAGLIGLCILATGLLSFLWPARNSKLLVAARWTSVAAAASGLLIGWLVVAGYPVDMEIDIMSGGRKVLTAGWLGLGLVLIAIGLVIATWAAWRNVAADGWGSRVARIHLTILAAASVVVSASLAYFHLIGGGY